jgi:hypothetical protein
MRIDDEHPRSASVITGRAHHYEGIRHAHDVAAAIGFAAIAPVWLLNANAPGASGLLDRVSSLRHHADVRAHWFGGCVAYRAVRPPAPPAAPTRDATEVLGRVKASLAPLAAARP